MTPSGGLKVLLWALLVTDVGTLLREKCGYVESPKHSDLVASTYEEDFKRTNRVVVWDAGNVPFSGSHDVSRATILAPYPIRPTQPHSGRVFGYGAHL